MNNYYNNIPVAPAPMSAPAPVPVAPAPMSAPAPVPVAPAPMSAPAPVPVAPAPVQNCGAVAYISGYVNNVYNGKKYTYVDVRVVANNGNYTDFKIAYPIGKGIYQLGTYINVNCTIKMFYDKTKNCFITTFYAD